MSCCQYVVLTYLSFLNKSAILTYLRKQLEEDLCKEAKKPNTEPNRLTKVEGPLFSMSSIFTNDT